MKDRKIFYKRWMLLLIIGVLVLGGIIWIVRLKNTRYDGDADANSYVITYVVKANRSNVEVYNVFPEYKDMNGLVGDSVQFSYPDVILDENGKKISSKELHEGDVVKVFYHQRSEEIAPPILELDEIVKMNE